jgi:DNA repair protein RadC
MQVEKEVPLMEVSCLPASILCSPGNHVKPILHINTEDVMVTKQAVEAGKLMDVEVLDHLVIGGPTQFVSLKERGLGFS